MWLLPALVYLSLTVFLAGMGWRVFTWLRPPVPLKIVLTPVPTTTAGVARRLAGEVLLFRSLLRADRWLWAAAWLFHVSLVLLAVGHIGGLVAPEFSQASLRLSEEQFHHLAQTAGGAIGILAMVSLFYLLARRVVAERTRWISTFSDYFALALLLLVISSGNQMRFLGEFDIVQARRFVAGLLSLHPEVAPASPAFTIHLLLVCALLVYIPFSKLIHLGGWAFNPTLNQTNDPRDRRHVGPWDRAQQAERSVARQQSVA